MAIFNRKNTKLAAISGVSMLLGAIAGGVAMADQGHMWNALHDLQAANAELQVAAHNKGGHRQAAIDLIGRAIYQVQAGIAAGDE